jgi:hypothetical protein
MNFARLTGIVLRRITVSGISGWGPPIQENDMATGNIATSVFREPHEGQKISFNVTQGQKGLRAEIIVPA